MMEDIDNNSKKYNVINIATIISKLIKDIENNALSNAASSKECPELRTLKEKCCDQNITTSLTALHGLVKLVESETLIGSQVIPKLISILPSVHHYSGIVSTVGNLMLLDLRSQIQKTGSYCCNFTLTESQHPLVTILKHDKEKSWPSVYSFIQLVVYKGDINWKHKTELLRPVLLYVFCDPSDSSSFQKIQLFHLLLKNWSKAEVQDVLLEILSWLQVDMTYCWLIQDICRYLLQNLNDKNGGVLSALTPLLGLTVRWLICNGHDPALLIDQLKCCLDVHKESSSVVLCMLGDVIIQTPTNYINDVVQFCKSIIFTSCCDEIIAHKIGAACLNWMLNPSALAEPLSKTVGEILIFLNGNETEWNDQTPKLLSNNHFNILKNSSSVIKSAVEICKLCCSWRKDQKMKLRWLENLYNTENSFIHRKLYLFVAAIVLHEKKEVYLDILLKILSRLIEIYSDLSYLLLCLLLYKLSKETEPSLQLKFLTLLPQMAVDKNNVPLIIATISTLKNGTERIMIPLTIRLLLSLWKVESRTYPHLYKVLTTSCHISGEIGWEIQVSRVIALKEICQTNPELHGKDLVSLLSEILNTYGNDESGLPSAYAIDAITELCKAQVINISGTWKALEPKLSRDKRPLVVTSLCKMFGEVPGLKSSDADYEKLTHNVITKLWECVFSNHKQVVEAALKAIGKFPVDSHKLKLLPEKIRIGLVLPKEYAKTPVDAARKPEDVLPYVPGKVIIECGECWVQLLTKINKSHVDEVCELLVVLTEKEISWLPRGVFYLAPGKPEPTTYSYLPHQSVLRGLMDYVQNQFKSSERFSISVEKALKILDHEYSKQLPPLNWSFLEDAVKLNNEASKYSLSILAKQAPFSQTAKVIIENYVNDFAPKSGEWGEILFLYSILPRLCNSIQPNYMRPFLEKTVKSVLEHDLNYESDNFDQIMHDIKSTLQRKDVHEANKTLLVMQMEGILPCIPTQHKIMKSYVDCATEFPGKYIERMTSPSVWWEVTPIKLQQSVAIRSAIALRPEAKTPLVWLNECIDVAGALTDQHGAVLRGLLTTIQKCRSNENNPKWTKELMCRTQASASSTDSTSEVLKVTLFLLDVFTSSTIVFSGYDCFVEDLDDIITIREKRLQLFPIALHELLSMPKWSELLPQVVEWIHRLSKWKDLPRQYSDIFQQCILLLRSSKYCLENKNWPRLFFFPKHEKTFGY